MTTLSEFCKKVYSEKLNKPYGQDLHNLTTCVRNKDMLAINFLLNDIKYQLNLALLEACGVGDLSIVELLIKSGADGHLKNSEPLVRAAGSGYVKLVKFLLKNGSDKHDLKRAYYCADLNGKTRVMELLEKYGASY